MWGWASPTQGSVGKGLILLPLRRWVGPSFQTSLLICRSVNHGHELSSVFWVYLMTILFDHNNIKKINKYVNRVVVLLVVLSSHVDDCWPQVSVVAMQSGEHLKSYKTRSGDRLEFLYLEDLSAQVGLLVMHPLRFVPCSVIVYSSRFKLWSISTVYSDFVEYILSLGSIWEGAPVQCHEDLGAEVCWLGSYVPWYQFVHTHSLHTG